MFSKEKNSFLFGGHGIVGAQVSLGNRACLRQSLPAVTIFVSPGLFRATAPPIRAQVYESFNMAELLEAPGDLRHREQPLRDGYIGDAFLRPRPIFPSAASPFKHSRRAG